MAIPPGAVVGSDETSMSGLGLAVSLVRSSINCTAISPSAFDGSIRSARLPLCAWASSAQAFFAGLAAGISWSTMVAAHAGNGSRAGGLDGVRRRGLLHRATLRRLALPVVNMPAISCSGSYRGFGPALGNCHAAGHRGRQVIAAIRLQMMRRISARAAAQSQARLSSDAAGPTRNPACNGNLAGYRTVECSTGRRGAVEATDGGRDFAHQPDQPLVEIFDARSLIRGQGLVSAPVALIIRPVSACRIRSGRHCPPRRMQSWSP